MFDDAFKVLEDTRKVLEYAQKMLETADETLEDYNKFVVEDFNTIVEFLCEDDKDFHYVHHPTTSEDVEKVKSQLRKLCVMLEFTLQLVYLNLNDTV